NLVNADGNNAQDVLLRDLVNHTNILVSATVAGGVANGDSTSPTVSTDGKYVLFRSTAQNLASGSFSGTSLFLRNVQLKTNYALATGSSFTSVSMTPNGRFVAFIAIGTPNTLYVWDSENVKRIYTNTSVSIGGTAI